MLFSITIRLLHLVCRYPNTVYTVDLVTQNALLRSITIDTIHINLVTNNAMMFSNMIVE